MPTCVFRNCTNYVAKDCRTQEQECTCPNPTSDCRCGLGGRCLPDGTCHAAECAKLGLRECQCVKKTTVSGIFQTGSMLGEMNMCGICCLMPVKGGGEHCVAAEEAAREKLASNYPVPEGWPDEEYKGPNMTVRLCEGFGCNKTYVRAWPSGSVCVTQNMVGMCSPRGLCKLDYITPRSNVYPDIMNVRLVGKSYSISRKLKPAPKTFIAILFFFCLIK